VGRGERKERSRLFSSASNQLHCRKQESARSESASNVFALSLLPYATASTLYHDLQGLPCQRQPSSLPATQLCPALSDHSIEAVFPLLNKRQAIGGSTRFPTNELRKQNKMSGSGEKASEQGHGRSAIMERQNVSGFRGRDNDSPGQV